ncbi:muconate/chloromuconate family cycloisomerase [Primorskyibacter flagellatus]|uniref:Muconate cycloisomerase n=1 Tax=Primorskyibacter flagellatus TaxID=1387277 RepID=A0A1W2DQ19_9RHOB|nr:muconate/chloromuconate family cycloisomerase [Primorskyibacter flagellatus]SMC99112.1 muconate cycloisomerase [Primorskyibacter flagellatus]
MAYSTAEVVDTVTQDQDFISRTAIREIRAQIVTLPSIRAHRLSNTEFSKREFVLVRVRLANGIEGIGEAAVLGGPRWAEESVESIQAVVTRYLSPALIGCPAARPAEVAARMSRAAFRNNSAKGAIETATFDALARSLDLSVTTLLGGALRESVPVLWALASGDADQEVEEARAKLATREHRDFKIKLGFASPEADLRRLQKLRDEVPEMRRLIVDVNQAWSEADCRRYLPILKELQVDLIEQPLPGDDFEGMARVAAQSPIPLMVDEAAFSHREITRAGTMGCGSVYSLKLVKSGGLMALSQAARVAESSGMELYGGCLLEGSIGAAAHLAVFATLPRLPWGCEHFGPRLHVSEIVRDPLVIEDFHLRVPQGPGLGVHLDEDRLRDALRPS